MSAQWYVVSTYSGHEKKVKANLEARIDSMGMSDRIFSVLVPEREQVEVRGGKRVTTIQRVYPGYVLVEMELDPASRGAVRNTPGVTSFIGAGDEPLPLSEAELARILGVGIEAPQVKIIFSAGQSVRITDGPFSDLLGTVDQIDAGRSKLRVLVSIFGRETPVELDFLQVARL